MTERDEIALRILCALVGNADPRTCADSAKAHITRSFDMTDQFLAYARAEEMSIRQRVGVTWVRHPDGSIVPEGVPAR